MALVDIISITFKDCGTERSHLKTIEWSEIWSRNPPDSIFRVTLISLSYCNDTCFCMTQTTSLLLRTGCILATQSPTSHHTWLNPAYLSFPFSALTRTKIIASWWWNVVWILQNQSQMTGVLTIPHPSALAQKLYMSLLSCWHNDTHILEWERF